METNVKVLKGEQTLPNAEGSWAETEWFQVWLELARRDYHGHPDWCESIHQDEKPLAA